jgi:hypothetical protein
MFGSRTRAINPSKINLENRIHARVGTYEPVPGEAKGLGREVRHDAAVMDPPYRLGSGRREARQARGSAQLVG